MDHKITIHKLISSYQRHEQRFRLLSNPPPATAQQQKNKTLYLVVCKNHHFFFFFLMLTSTNSVEISNNKHFVFRCTIKFNKLSDDPITLFDTGVTG